MTLAVVDVVNFNADASCLSTTTWLAAMDGGRSSSVCQWLLHYVHKHKRVTLGFMGSALAELKAFNPHALDILAEHPQVFELVARPFAHDIALLRHPHQFTLNVRLGLKTLAALGLTPTLAFLPPEFMLTPHQVSLLRTLGLTATFIHPRRFPPEQRGRIPASPYLVTGTAQDTLTAVPFDPSLCAAYLLGIQQYGAVAWNRASQRDGTLFSWRDGESGFLLGDAAAREESWLTAESTNVERVFVREALLNLPLALPAPPAYQSYPPHSLAPWSRGQRMLGYLRRLADVEHQRVRDGADPLTLALWSHAAGSDVLSSVEKRSPVVTVCPAPGAPPQQVTLYRTERGMEGEQALAMMEGSEPHNNAPAEVARASTPFLKRVKARWEFLQHVP